MNKAMQITIAKAALAGYRIVPARLSPYYWHLYTPDGGWIGQLFDTRYEAAKYAVECLEAEEE